MTSANTLTPSGTADNTALALNMCAGTVILAKTSSASVHAAAGRNISIGTVQLAGTGGDQIADSATAYVSGGSLDMNARNETFFSLTLAGSGASGNGALVNSAAAGCQLILPGGITLFGNTTIGVTQPAGVLTLNDPSPAASRSPKQVWARSSWAAPTPSPAI